MAISLKGFRIVTGHAEIFCSACGRSFEMDFGDNDFGPPTWAGYEDRWSDACPHCGEGFVLQVQAEIKQERGHDIPTDTTLSEM